MPKDIFKRKDNVFYILILRRKFVEILVTEIIRIFHSGLSFMFCPLVLLWQLYSIVFLSQSYQGLLSLYFQGPLSLSGKLEYLIVRLISVTSVTFSVFLSLFHSFRPILRGPWVSSSSWCFIVFFMYFCPGGQSSGEVFLCSFICWLGTVADVVCWSCGSGTTHVIGAEKDVYKNCNSWTRGKT